MLLAKKCLLILFGLFSITQAVAKDRFALIINESKEQVMRCSYFDGKLLDYKTSVIKVGDTAKIAFEDKLFNCTTVYVVTEKYIGMSICVMPGDVAYAAYDMPNDVFNFKGRNIAELNLYTEFGKSDFSSRKIPSPIMYSTTRPFKDFLYDWGILCIDARNFTKKVALVKGVRPEVKKHLILEIELRLFNILLNPIILQSEDEKVRPLSTEYKSAVTSFFKEITASNGVLELPQTVFMLRSYTMFLISSKGIMPNFTMQYNMAKQEYSEYIREWVCYSVLKDMMLFNKNVEVIPSLLQDYKGWVSENSIFLKKLIQFNGYDNLDTLSSEIGNDIFVDSNDELIKLSDIIRNLKGQVIYIDLWASWCGPCVAEMPASVEMRELYKNRKLSVVYLSVDENKSKWIGAADNFLAKSRESYRFKDANKASLVKKLKISSIPRYLLLDKEGVLRYNNAPPPSDPTLSKLIDSLL